jgi:hypothetical protein
MPRTPSEVARTGDERAVEAMVERLLEAVGELDFTTLQTLFAANGTIASAGMKEGGPVSRVLTVAEWAGRHPPDARRYRETMSHATMFVDEFFAFVRIEATVIVEDEPHGQTLVYCTLAKDGGRWKFVSACTSPRG